MKKRFITLLLALLVVIVPCVQAEEEEDEDRNFRRDLWEYNASAGIQRDGVNEIRIRCLEAPGRNFKARDYDYTTTNSEYIDILINCLNSMRLCKECDIYGIADTTSFDIFLNGVQEYEITLSLFRNINVEKYDEIYYYDYIRFLDTVKALKKGTYFPSDWANRDVESAIEAGILTDNLFGLYRDSINREQACEIVYNAIKHKIRIEGSIADVFEDTDSEGVCMLYSLGIVNGKSEELFCPNDYLTREEFAKLLVGAYCYVMGDDTGKDYNNTQFNDTELISSWAVPYVAVANKKGLLIGDQAGNFAPQKMCTKEQTVVATLRLYREIGGL